MGLRVVIADDHPLVRKAVREALEQVDDMEVVGEASSGTDLLALVATKRPDVAVIDIRMPGMDGLSCVEVIREKHPDVKAVILSASSGRAQVEAAFRRGATSYVMKSIDPADLPSAIRQAKEQTVFHAGRFGQANGHTAPADRETQTLDLTEREMTILRAVARGLSNGDVSREYWVSEKTVKFHLTNIYRKLGVTNRTAAARAAHQHGLLETSL
jgi:two-component system response regulator DegU